MSLDQHIQRPEDMVSYLSNYGWHFNKKMCEFASKMMKRKNPTTEKMEKIEPFNKDQVEAILSRQKVSLENSKGYDLVFVANMAMADFWQSSIEDEKHLALYIKDVVDDPDQEDGFIFRRWYSDMIGSGEPIEWEDML